MKTDVEIEQLKNLLEHVAAESCEAISTTQANNSTVTIRVSVPTRLGEKRYWLQLQNDTTHTWIQGGLGSTPVSTTLRVFVPGMVNASGVYVSGHGFAELVCEIQGTTVCLNLSGES
jgi:hypothetical protein